MSFISNIYVNFEKVRSFKFRFAYNGRVITSKSDLIT